MSQSRRRAMDMDARAPEKESVTMLMSCEKEFQASNNTFLYCSEACRIHDTQSSQPSPYFAPSSPPPSPYPMPSSSTEGPDIIPRFSPTQSRPRSYFNSDPYPSSSYQSHPTYTPSPPSQASHTYNPPSALHSLRSLATALPRHEPESPPSSISRTSSAIFNYMPFTTSKTTQTAYQTPGNSYSGTTYTASQSSGRSREDLYSYGRSYGTSNGVAYANVGGMGMDRPLPPRNPGPYGHRPRSIDLVTPYGGGS
ncbi:hypothetical protein GLAREA_09860 [Glarea lozoyensis ATCC 20868]|uniref:Life-span regulatory factor domain-containing protein n=1 Tax=Glarea lozoyensis (strain ATCC 20868 / MF5171) TaxID=1116229 RepID=S3CUT3_GLAL2|nr:uncharacterized protein GLAREA_09860 [Glarea lozoyensis ATCC 20868]EPE28739.1 hypothetical protein GLAREA_09860 [Glarea lozoyensis ATCC 20868]